MLTILPECGHNFLPVFRCVQGFCIGEGFLGPSDEPLLVEQMKLCSASKEGGESSDEKEGEGKGEGDVSTEEEQKCERLRDLVSSLSSTCYQECISRPKGCNLPDVL